MRKLLPLALLLLASSIAHADPAASVERRDSVNVSPLGLLFGDVNVNYEHMFDGGHAVIAELGGGRDAGDAGSDTHGSMAVGYRWHWQKKQNSGFLGVTLAQGVGNGYVEENNMRYDMRVSSTTLTGNIGKRWMLGDSAWNITLRFGLGWGHHSATAKDSTPEAKMAEGDMNKILSVLPFGAEGELSLGYTF